MNTESAFSSCNHFSYSYWPKIFLKEAIRDKIHNPCLVQKCFQKFYLKTVTWTMEHKTPIMMPEHKEETGSTPKSTLRLLFRTFRVMWFIFRKPIFGILKAFLFLYVNEPEPEQGDGWDLSSSIVWRYAHACLINASFPYSHIHNMFYAYW